MLNQSIQSITRHVLVLGVVFAGAFSSMACGEMDSDDPIVDEAIRASALQSSFCEVNVAGHGLIDVEDEYIARVVACENGNAAPAALEAQAIAARTYAAFMMKERGVIQDSQAGQVFTCSTSPGPQHYAAARATSGQVLTHDGELIASFYVSGVKPSTSSCVPSARDKSNASSTDGRVEKYVTYNSGRIGGSVQPSSLGHMQNPHNRGCMSQNGSDCLAGAGRSASSILRFYYGDDVRVTQLGGQCVSPVEGGGEPPPSGGGGVDEPPEGADECTSAAQGVTILPRSSWGARSPRKLRSTHSPDRITIHHTYSSLSSDGATAVRNIQSYHMNGRGWNDIAYHFLIARDGTIYEGNPEGRMGAHVKSQNSGNLGISLIGTYSSGKEQPRAAQIQATARLVRHLSDKYGIALNRAKVKGHGERMSTDCPGANVDLDRIVAMAGADAVCDDPTPEPEPDRDLGLPDIDLGDGALYRYVKLEGESGATIVDSVYLADGVDDRAGDSITRSSGTQNANAILGLPDVMTCAEVGAKAAVISAGGEVVVEFDPPFRGDQRVAIVSSASGTDPCREGGAVVAYVSTDGVEWIQASEAIGSDSTFDPPSPRLSIVKPVGDTAPRDTQFAVDASEFIVRVEYYAEDYLFSTSYDAASGFEVDFSFVGTGERLISAWGYDASGEAVAMDSRKITIEPDTSTFNFITPKSGSISRPEISFTVEAGDPAVVKVQYQRKDGSALANMTNRGAKWAFGITLDTFGERTFHAVGYDSAGAEIGRDTISVMISTSGGTIPPGEGDAPDTGTPGVDEGRANDLATEAYNYGAGKRSGGYCWRGVKTAALKAKVTDGYNWPQLQSKGPCSANDFALSAYCFKRQADANPSALRSAYGFAKVNVDPRNAPRGAILAYDKGCAGTNARHGHIEVAQGDGTACSDYCGTIRSGATSCASVFVPVSTSGGGNNGGQSGGVDVGPLVNTYYWLSLEDDYSGADDTTLYDSQCRPVARVPAAFSDKACIEGSARLDDGTVVNYASRCNCGRRCPSGSTICWKALDSGRFPWGQGSRSNPLVPMRSLAVDTNHIAIGTKIYMPRFDGFAVPRVGGAGGFTHDGCFEAADVGGAIRGKRIDIFSGTKAMRNVLEGSIATRSSLEAYANHPSCP